MSGRVAGKVVIVTGGGNGLGAAYCRALAAEGASVVVADLDAAAAAAVAADCGGPTVPMVLDVADEGSWSQLVQDVVGRLGGVDGLVNNAGIVTRAALAEVSVADLERVLAVNVIGSVLGMRTVIEPMRARGGGSIVNVSSVAGMTGVPGITGYTASKWAIRGLTRAAATELAPLGIRVNVVAPGVVDTPMVRAAGRPPRNLQRRAADPAEVAPVVVHLISDESSYSTGADFVVDGGETSSSRLEVE